MGSLWAVPELSGDFLCSFLVTLMVWEHFYTVHDLHLAQIRLTAEHARLDHGDNRDGQYHFARLVVAFTRDPLLTKQVQ